MSGAHAGGKPDDKSEDYASGAEELYPTKEKARRPAKSSKAKLKGRK